MDSKIYKKKENPIKRATVFSKAVLWWFRKIIWKSYTRNITVDDLYETLDQDAAHELGNRLEKSWDKQLAVGKRKGTTPSLIKALLEMFWVSVLSYAFLFILDFAIIRAMTPVLLGKVIEYFGQTSTVQLLEVYVYAGGLVFILLIRIFCWHHYSKEAQFIGMRIRVACCSLIYRKVLRLSKQTVDSTATGYIVNLMTNDVSRFDKIVIWMHFLWVPLIQIPIIMFWLYSYVRWASFIGVAFAFIITLPSQFVIGKLSNKYRGEVALRTDERMKMMNEIVSGMRVIKMYGWETPFAKLVAQARKSEISKVSRTAYLRNSVLAFAFFVDRSALFLTLLAYWLSGSLATTYQIFAMTQFFQSLNVSVGILIPIAASFIGEARVSIRRTEEFLMKPEVCEVPQDESVLRGELSLQRATASWDGSLHALKDVSLRVLPGQLCGIVGAIGSGKSTVLQVILGEIQLESGVVSVNGRVAYASQEPWIFVGTVRNNILLGRPYRRDWYRQVVRACALERDFQLLPKGDATLVGQKGATLSGGQRARINLARAVYGEADIYLLDDPLSAVDTHVGKHLFEQCVCSLLAGKTRILVTHQIQHLTIADHIVLLNEGRTENQGSFRNLAEGSAIFLELLTADEEEDDQGETVETGNVITETDIRISSRISISQKSTEVFNVGVPATTFPPDDDAEAEVDTQLMSRAIGGYLRAAGNCCSLGAIAVLLVTTQAVVCTCDYWLSFWTSAEEDREQHTYEAHSTEWFIEIYGIIVTIVVVLSIARAMGFVAMCMRASRRLHNTMFQRVLNAPMRFFDTNPSGRILNRFSKDIGAIDELLPFPALDMMLIFLCMFGVLVLVLISQYLAIIPLTIVGVLFVCFSVLVISTGRNLKKLEGIRRSPLFSHLSDTLNGLTTIRAARVQELVRTEFDNHQDRHTSAWFLYICNGTVLGLWLDMLSAIFVGALTFTFILINSDTTGDSDVGLAISQSLVLMGMLQYGVMQMNEVVSQATSIERVLEYTRLQPEKRLTSLPGKEPPPNWPSRGAITFRKVYLRYAEGAPAVLKGVSFTIEPTHKVGIVGRTGAGKSSLLAALFRLSPLEGSVLLDDVDTASVGLHDLRRRISIIPQEPVLFSASMRFNLDPFAEFTDDQLWAALQDVELRNVFATLDAQVTEGGGNLSVGQRQLVCLARAILRNNKVLVVDEATANVDPDTDALIQNTIRAKFRECTVLTIAHRLHTIMDSDRVLVMDAGQVAEFGAPYELLQRRDGDFSSMVRETGHATERQLREMARMAYFGRDNADNSQTLR